MRLAGAENHPLRGEEGGTGCSKAPHRGDSELVKASQAIGHRRHRNEGIKNGPSVDRKIASRVISSQEACIMPDLISTSILLTRYVTSTPGMLVFSKCTHHHKLVRGHHISFILFVLVLRRTLGLQPPSAATLVSRLDAKMRILLYCHYCRNELSQVKTSKCLARVHFCNAPPWPTAPWLRLDARPGAPFLLSLVPPALDITRGGHALAS